MRIRTCACKPSSEKAAIQIKNSNTSSSVAVVGSRHSTALPILIWWAVSWLITHPQPELHASLQCSYTKTNSTSLPLCPISPHCSSCVSCPTMFPWSQGDHSPPAACRPLSLNACPASCERQHTGTSERRSVMLAYCDWSCKDLSQHKTPVIEPLRTCPSVCFWFNGNEKTGSSGDNERCLLLRSSVPVFSLFVAIEIAPRGVRNDRCSIEKCGKGWERAMSFDSWGEMSSERMWGSIGGNVMLKG